MARYGKRDDLIVHELEPFNVETCSAALAEDAVTATDAFYVRAHGAVPEVEPGEWHLRVHGLVERELTLSLSTLREAFRERTETATLQCAGNRRAGLVAIRDIPGEAPWGAGATGTATWTGVALADVLALAGPLPRAAHVGFEGADLSPEARPQQRFGGSVPLDKACRPEVLLAWAMNGEPLAPVYGAPLRVVVPGYIGARSVKWPDRIEVRSTPWQGYFQHVVYRLLPEDGSVGPGEGMPLGLVALELATCSARPTARRSTPARSSCAATPSRAGSATSRASTSPSTVARAGFRPSCSTTMAAGRGGHRRISGGPRRPGEHAVAVGAWDPRRRRTAGRGRARN